MEINEVLANSLTFLKSAESPFLIMTFIFANTFANPRDDKKVAKKESTRICIWSSKAGKNYIVLLKKETSLEGLVTLYDAQYISGYFLAHGISSLWKASEKAMTLSAHIRIRHADKVLTYNPEV